MTDSINIKNNSILDNIIKASANSDLQVTEDIYDQYDHKLLAKGYKITPEIQEKLYDKVLKKPIETCIQSDNSITSQEISTAALALIENTPILSLISSSIESEAKDLVNLKIEPLAAMLLTVMRDGGSDKFNHSLLVTLVARSIAKNLNLQHRDITNLTLSSLLHDVGELYVSIPESGTLTINDWRNVMAHPVLGSSIVKLYMDYPLEISAAILEHHERCDCTGYPKKLNANNCSTNGQVLILAEAIAGILKPGTEVQNVILAFKMSSGVYPVKPLTVFNSMLKSLEYVRNEMDKDSAINDLQHRIKALDEVQPKIEGLLKKSDLPLLIEESARHLRFRIEKLKQSIFSSGMQYYLDDDSWKNSEDSQIIMLELEIAVSEVGWQIQDMLRDITLRLLDFNADFPPEFSEVTEQLAQLNEKKNSGNNAPG